MCCTLAKQHVQGAGDVKDKKMYLNQVDHEYY